MKIAKELYKSSITKLAFKETIYDQMSNIIEKLNDTKIIFLRYYKKIDELKTTDNINLFTELNNLFKMTENNFYFLQDNEFYIQFVSDLNDIIDAQVAGKEIIGMIEALTIKTKNFINNLSSSIEDLQKVSSSLK